MWASSNNDQSSVGYCPTLFQFGTLGTNENSTGASWNNCLPTDGILGPILSGTQGLGSSRNNFGGPEDTHLVITYAVGEFPNFYVDGVLSFTSTSIVTAEAFSRVITSPTNYLGRSLLPSNIGFVGSINEFRIWSGSLSAYAVTDTYNAGPNHIPLCKKPELLTLEPQASPTMIPAPSKKPAGRPSAHYPSVPSTSFSPTTSRKKPTKKPSKAPVAAPADCTYNHTMRPSAAPSACSYVHTKKPSAAPSDCSPGHLLTSSPTRCSRPTRQYQNSSHPIAQTESEAPTTANTVLHEQHDDDFVISVTGRSKRPSASPTVAETSTVTDAETVSPSESPTIEETSTVTDTETVSPTVAETLTDAETVSPSASPTVEETSTVTDAETVSPTA